MERDNYGGKLRIGRVRRYNTAYMRGELTALETDGREVAFVFNLKDGYHFGLDEEGRPVWKTKGYRVYPKTNELLVFQPKEISDGRKVAAPWFPLDRCEPEVKKFLAAARIRYSPERR